MSPNRDLSSDPIRVPSACLGSPKLFNVYFRVVLSIRSFDPRGRELLAVRFLCISPGDLAGAGNYRRHPIESLGDSFCV